jgi:hypothetical protein
MAKDKKGFILYADQRSIIELLDNETAGKLLKHIYSYVNDENPISDNAMLNLAFEPIKLQLKRDLKTYENICNRNKENGFKGGRPKKPKKPTGLLGNPKKPKKADTDNDTDNDILIPTIVDFLKYCETIKEFDYKQYEYSYKSKYETWVNDGWVDGNGNKITNWKSKIRNTAPYLKPIKKQVQYHHDNNGII